MKEILIKFRNGMVQGLGILAVIGLVGYTYAATVGIVTTGQSLTAEMWNSMTGNYNYSLSEVNTGKKWINGKPIYRKVVNLGNLSGNVSSDNTWHNSSLNLSSVETLVSSEVSLSGVTNVYSLYVSASVQIRFYVNKTSFSHVFSSNYSNFFNNVVVIAEYTKTTD